MKLEFSHFQPFDYFDRKRIPLEFENDILLKFMAVSYHIMPHFLEIFGK